MKYLVAYDISNDKKRKKLGDILEGYGFRVNFSVFEIEISQTKLKKLLLEIEEQKLIDKKQDSFRFYHICKNCVPKCFEVCDKPDMFEEIQLFF